MKTILKIFINEQKKSSFEMRFICDTQGKYTCTFQQVCVLRGIQRDKG